MLKNYKNPKKYFTLVELIVVVSIIGILGLIGVLILGNWVGLSKDSRKISDLNTIKKALDIYVLQNGSNIYPLPDSYFDVLDENNNIIWHQGVFGSNLTNLLKNFNTQVIDPDGKYYDYSVTSNLDGYELRTFLEEKNKYFSYTSNSYAHNGYVKTLGEFNGWIIIKDISEYSLINIPSLFINRIDAFNLTNKLSILDSNNTISIPNSMLDFNSSNIKKYNITNFVKYGDKTDLESIINDLNSLNLDLQSLLKSIEKSSGSSYIVEKSYFNIKTKFSRNEILNSVDNRTNRTGNIDEFVEIKNYEINDSIKLYDPIINGKNQAKLLLENKNGNIYGKILYENTFCNDGTVLYNKECLIVNCEGLFKNGYIDSGYYKLDFDGNGGQSSISVYCDMTNNGKTFLVNPNNLIGYWNFNNTLLDKSIHTRHGEGYGGTFESGIIGNAIKLNGTNKLGEKYNWIDIPNIRIDNGQPWAVSAWIKIPNDSYGIENKMSLIGSNKTYSVIASNNGINNWYIDGNGNPYNGGNCLNTVKEESWHHGLWMSDGKKFYSYIDGVKVGDVQVTNTLLEIDGIGIGYNSNMNIFTWDGYIDDLFIINDFLSDEQIQNIYNAGLLGVGFSDN